MKSEVPGTARIFLLFCAIGLTPIALSYGAFPSLSLEALFGITVEGTNLAHIMRAVMGLYLAMVSIWVAGAFIPGLCRPALVCCAAFMLGLACGRVLSIAVDGFPHWILILYTVLEIILGTIAIILLREPEKKGI